ncbi:Conserved_hypothetical protein [Hexamita inflata]|uniref:Uncharacterized protein n=1 Tax=Hexamita inflata TaxID=28002 RepID=A0ABP1HRW8_9EUKA
MFAGIPNQIEVLAVVFICCAFIICSICGLYLQILSGHKLYKILVTAILSITFVITFVVGWMFTSTTAIITGIGFYIVMGVWVCSSFVQKEQNFVAELMEFLLHYLLAEQNKKQMKRNHKHNMKALRTKLGIQNPPTEEEKQLIWEQFRVSIDTPVLKGKEVHQKFPKNIKIIISLMVTELLFKEMGVKNLQKMADTLSLIDKKKLWWNERELVTNLLAYVIKLKEDTENEDEDKIQDYERDSKPINKALLGSHVLMFFYYLPWAIFGFILNTTDMVQFFALIGLEMKNINSTFFILPNAIYDFISRISTLTGFLISLLIVVVTQTITDYQTKEFSDLSNGDFLVLAKFFTKLWDKCCIGKTCIKGSMNLRSLLHKTILIVLSNILSFCGMIMQQYITNLISNSTDINQTIPLLIVFVVFVIQVYDCKFMSMVIQLLVYYVNSTTWKDLLDFRSWAMLFFVLATILQITFTGFFEQLLFPFDFIGGIFSIHNANLKASMTEFQKEKPIAKFSVAIFILLFLLTPLCDQPAKTAYILIGLIVACIAYTLLLSLCTFTGRKDYLDIATEQFNKCSTLEVRDEQHPLWQNFMVSQKCMKYSAIPYVGSIVGCIAGYINNPPYIIEGKPEETIEYVKSWLMLAGFLAFVFLFGSGNKWYWIPLSEWIILFIYDTWDEVQDFLNVESYGINDLVGRAMKSLCCGIDADQEHEGPIQAVSESVLHESKKQEQKVEEVA